MALQKNITLDNTLEVKDAYIRIESINGDKTHIDMYVSSYVSADAQISGATALNRKFYSFIPNTEDDAANFIKQGYEYLKTLDAFKDAIDV